MARRGHLWRVALYQDIGVCAVCDGAIEWPCATAKAAMDALEYVGGEVVASVLSSDDDRPVQS